jgi:hypothetical protein
MKRLAQNSQRSAKSQRRGPGRKFKPGQSGNPGGRPKSADANALIRAAFEEKGDGVVRALYALATDPDKRLRLAAIREVLDRVLGQAKQGLEITDNEAPATRAALIAELRADLIAADPRLAEKVAKVLGDAR